MSPHAWRRGFFAAAAVLTAAGAGTVPCTIDQAPAATLLVPYFRVNTSECGGAGEATIVTVVNVTPDPVLTHVTAWSNLGVPVTGFDLYLQGYDTQTLSLLDLVCSGFVPITGPGFSPVGAFSNPPVSFPGCSDPVAEPLSPSALATMQSYLNGEQATATGLCAGWPTGWAEGYLTVDVTNGCTNLTPADGTYQSSLLGFTNALAGEYQVIDTANNFAQGFEAVHLEAYPTVFAAGDVTFYGRYNGASAADAREPLGTAYGTPYDLTAAASARTDLVVWRETDATAPFSCTGLPPWYPLPTRSVIAFPDRDTAGRGGLPAHADIPLATQQLRLGQRDVRLHPATSETGWLFLDLQHPVSAYPAALHVGQAWVSAKRLSEGRYSVGGHGDQLDSACKPTSFSFSAPPRAGVFP